MAKLLTPEEYSVKNIFDGGQYVIPVYQRPYSWGESQINQLLSDIDETFKIYKDQANSQNTPELFAGTFFMKTIQMKKNTVRVWEVVDGQQRITTFTLILMCLLNKLVKLPDSEDETRQQEKKMIIDEIKSYLWKALEVLPDKNERVLTLGGIDKDILNKVFDELYAKKDIVDFANVVIDKDINDIEKNLLNNIQTIDKHFAEYSVEECIKYFSCIKNYVKFVNIATEVDLPKLFNIFESINSKGKPLEDIDLIKSYIFQNLDMQDYEEYLEKWGQLIIDTNDNLMDYLTIYVRANISYCKNSIKLQNFKALVGNGFAKYFETNSRTDTLKALIDGLRDNVEFYKNINAVTDDNDLHLKAVLLMNQTAQYNHNKALYFKMLYMVKNCGLSPKIAADIMKKAFCFILTFQSICSRESKKTLNVFAEVQNVLYKDFRSVSAKANLENETYKLISDIFDRHIVENNINDDLLVKAIEREITYDSSYVTKTILAYLDSINSDRTLKSINLCQLLRAGKDLTLDHILPQTPEKDDANYRYYVDPTNKDLVRLKDGQDFTVPECRHIQKDDFYRTYLHVLGNMRLQWRDDNSRKKNSCITLPEFGSDFCTYENIKNRTQELIQKLMWSKLLLSTNDIGTDVLTSKKSVSEIVSINEYSSDFKSDQYRPIGFDLLGDNYKLTETSYRELAVQVLEKLYVLDNCGIEKLAANKFSFTKSDRVAISDDAKDISGVAQMIADKVYLDVNYSSPYTIMLLYTVIKEMGLGNSDLVIYFTKK